MVFVQWDGTARLLNGDASYFNRGLHVMTLRWGKISALDVFEDSQEVARGLAAQAAAGLDEAVAEQIVSCRAESEAHRGNSAWGARARDPLSRLLRLARIATRSLAHMPAKRSAEGTR